MFAITIKKEQIKFSAAHFVARGGFRGPLHGHNYTIAIRVDGDLRPDGYVMDFGVMKRAAKEIADELDQRTIIPLKNPDIEVRILPRGQVSITCEGDDLVTPQNDTILLPISHSTVEELAEYVSGELRRRLNEGGEMQGIRTLEVTVAEGPGEEATFRREIKSARDRNPST